MIESIEELRKICQSRKEEIWYYNITRKISIYITRSLLNTNLTANQVTLLNMLPLLIGGSLLTLGNYWYSIIGALLFNLHCVFDCVDGELARYESHKCIRTRWASLIGGSLETISHSIMVPFVFVCTSFGVYKDLQDMRVLMLGFSMAFSFTLEWLSDLTFYKFHEAVYAQAFVQKYSKATGILSKIYHHKITVKVRNNFFVGATIFFLILVTVALNCLYVVPIFYGTTLPLFVIISIYLKAIEFKMKL